MDIFLRFLNGFLMIAMPLALGVYLARRLGLAWRLFGIGAATFAISQLFHIPFNFLVLAPALEPMGAIGELSGVSLVTVPLLYGLSAGIFEETARYLTYRFWLRKSRQWRQALMFGAGHAGFEAIILGLVVVYALFQALALRKVDTSTIVPPDRLVVVQQQLQTYWSVPWYGTLLGALERALAMCLHLALASLVLQAVTRRNILWLGLAVVWHTLANASVLILFRLSGPYAAEGLLAIVAALSLAVLFALRRGEVVPSLAHCPPATPPPVKPEPIPRTNHLSSERIEESRYANQ